ncbi:MAG TPA: hypothetical protein VFV73_04145 [Streptosporangiaceae bacterium]|nr:hypothetical protein [Streptosporangiaceae bacterium]
MTGRSFPRGAGIDFAGQVVEAADDLAGLVAGDEVWGFLDVGSGGGHPGRRLGTSSLPPRHGFPPSHD